MEQVGSLPTLDIPEEFKCPVCKNDLRELEPKLLPCLHTVCNGCISSESSNNTGLRCVVCRQECPPEEVILNQFIKDSGLQNESNTDERKEHVCTSCEDKEVATSYCSECSEWLCSTCVQAHQRVRMTKDHAIQSKEEALAEQNINVTSQRALFCQIHKQEQLKLFCETCDVLTCRDCQLGDHREHRYQFVSEASHQHKIFLQTLLQKLREKKSYMEAAKSLISKRYKDIGERELLVTEEIKHFAIRFITEINKRGKQLLSELHEVCMFKKIALGHKNNDLIMMAAKLEHCLNFVEKAVEQSSDTALLFSKRLISNQLRNVLRSHCEVPNPNHSVDIRFACDSDTFSKYINQMGRLMVDGGFNPRQFMHMQQPAAPPPYSAMAGLTNMRVPTGAILNKQMPMGMFGPLPNPNQPHVVSSSTHPVDFQRNIRLRNLLEQSAPIPAQVTRPAGNYFHSPPIPKDGHHSSLVQRNSALFSMLMNTSTVRAESLPSPATITSMPLPMPTLTPISQGTNLPVDKNWSSINQQLSKTQRLSHYPLSSTSTPSNSPTFGVIIATTQEQHSSSPQSTQSSPGHSSLPVHQALNMNQSIPSVNSLHGKDGQSDIFAANSQTKPNVKTSMKEEENKPFASCFVGTIKIKQEAVDDAKEIADTAQRALSFFCNGNMNIMGAPSDAGNEVEVLSNSPQNNKDERSDKILSKPNTDQEKNCSDLEKAGTVQQADSSCSPGLMALDCNLTVATLVNGIHGSKLSSAVKCPTSAGKIINNLQESQDPNDDWCAVCHDGGDLLCCGHCPRVYHLGCHIPSLSEFPGQEDQWQCLMCRNENELHRYIVKESSQNQKRKNCVGLNGNELRLGERILLEMFCVEPSYSFHHPVSRAEAPDYHKIITNPMDMSTIKKKLSPCHFNHYMDVNELFEDVKLIFKNCYLYNGPVSQVYKAGQLLEDLFKTLVRKYMPSYEKMICECEDNKNSDDKETPKEDKEDDSEPGKKKKKLDFIIW